MLKRRAIWHSGWTGFSRCEPTPGRTTLGAPPRRRPQVIPARGAQPRPRPPTAAQPVAQVRARQQRREHGRHPVRDCDHPAGRGRRALPAAARVVRLEQKPPSIHPRHRSRRKVKARPRRPRRPREGRQRGTRPPRPVARRIDDPRQFDAAAVGVQDVPALPRPQGPTPLDLVLRHQAPPPRRRHEQQQRQRRTSGDDGQAAGHGRRLYALRTTPATERCSKRPHWLRVS